MQAMSDFAVVTEVRPGPLNAAAFRTERVKCRAPAYWGSEIPSRRQAVKCEDSVVGS